MSATRRIYWDDPFQTTVTALVTATDAEYVVLDRTLFHPRGGGQPDDLGTANGIALTGLVKLPDGGIGHAFDGAGELTPGEPVELELDWERRWALMRHHTLLHLVHLAFLDTHGESDDLGSAVAVDKARIEYAFHGDVHLEALQEEVERILNHGGQPVTVVGEDGQRFWQLEGWPPIPCGGTHVIDLATVGPVALRKKSAGKRGVRIYAQCTGER